jgi:hypothetical protein
MSLRLGDASETKIYRCLAEFSTPDRPSDLVEGHPIRVLEYHFDFGYVAFSRVWLFEPNVRISNSESSMS